MMGCSNVLKYQFASFLPNTEFVHAHPEGFPSPRSQGQTPVVHAEPTRKTFNSSAALLPKWRLRDSDTCLQKGWLFPRSRQVMQWVTGETMGDSHEDRRVSEENQQVSAGGPCQQKGVWWAWVHAELMPCEASSPWLFPPSEQEVRVALCFPGQLLIARSFPYPPCEQQRDPHWQQAAREPAPGFYLRGGFWGLLLAAAVFDFLLEIDSEMWICMQ